VTAKSAPADGSAGYVTELVPVARLLEMAAPYNPRRIEPAELESLRRSLRFFGLVEPVVANRRTQHVVGGHQRVKAAEAEGWTEVAVHWIDVDSATEKQLNLALNRISGAWDDKKLEELLRDLDASGADLGLTGFTEAEVGELLGLAETPARGLTDPDELPIAPKVPVAKLGDLWQLGRHRLLCGSCTDVRAVRSLLGEQGVDLICTDPPYCSGGFQEGQRARGSIGTARKPGTKKRGGAKPQIATDTLSTRGYIALLSAMLALWPARAAYVFTDWRMWVSLFDVAEASGYGVRQMVVWDKETPGLGVGWRAQHELVLFGIKAKLQFDGKLSSGNVIRSKRTGNPLHVTQKPVDVLQSLLRVCSFAQRVADPFAGSGSTLIAATDLDRDCFAAELDPAYCDVLIERWQDYTGQAAERIARVDPALAAPNSDGA
jgi:DNA modification methylase